MKSDYARRILIRRLLLSFILCCIFIFFYFFTSRLSRFFFFCHILLGAIPLLLFLWAFRVNWQYEEGPDHTNITSKQQQIKQKRTYLLQS